MKCLLVLFIFDYDVQLLLLLCLCFLLQTTLPWLFTMPMNLSKRKENPPSQKCSAMHIKRHAQVFEITLKFSTSHRWFWTHVLFNLRRKRSDCIRVKTSYFMFYVLTHSNTLSYLCRFHVAD